MIVYILKRLVAMVPTLLGITFVTFLIISLAPGDPVAISFGQEGGGGPSAEGGGGNRERQADTIKAKKKLLGILSEDRSVLRWSLAAEPANSGPDELPLLGRLAPSPAWLRVLALDAERGRLHVAGDDGSVRVVDLSSGDVRLLHAGHADAVHVLAVSGDGRHVASADTQGVVLVVDQQDPEPPLARWELGGRVHDLAFRPGSPLLLAACEDGLIRELDPEASAVTRELSGHVARVQALAVSRDGRMLWSAGYDRTLQEWDLARGEVVREIGQHGQAINDLSLSADGSRLASACDDRIARVFSVKGAEEPLEIRGHFKQVTAVGLSPDGSVLVTGSRDETVRVWDAETGRPLLQAARAVGAVDDLVVDADGASAFTVGESWAKVPIWRRYVRWLGRIATFDFDRSFKDNLPVTEKMARALPITLGLNVLALCLIYTIAIPLGVLAAVRRGSRFDHVTSLLVFMLYSMPNFWVATLLIMTFSSKLNWDILPSVGLHAQEAGDYPYFRWLGDFAAHLVLPVLTLTYSGFASLSRYARTSMLEAIGQDYVRTARAKGLSETAVVFKHALRNSMITIITLMANLLPAMIGGSVIVEYVYSIEGMGKLGFDAILARDYPVTMAITTCAAFLTLLGILVSDLLYSVADPRISHE